MRSEASADAKKMQITPNELFAVQNEERTDVRVRNEQFGISGAKFLVD